MNLCVLTSSFPSHANDAAAAAGLFVRDFCLKLAEQGHQVTVITQAKSGPYPEPPGSLRVVWYPWPGRDTPLGYLKPYQPQHAWWMRRLFAEAGSALAREHEAVSFDHVIAMWAVPAGWIARRFKRRTGVPYSVWCLGSDIWTYGRYPILRTAVSKVIREAENVWADGLELGERVQELSGRNAEFLPSSRSLTASAEGDVNVDLPRPRFLFVGRYAPVKGVDILLDAFARYIAEGGTGHLILYGAGPDEVNIRTRAEASDLRGRVFVNGLADEAVYASELCAADCMMIPSRRESIPVVLSDALQFGVPVIASDTGDIGRLLRETPAGIVVPVEDVEALAEAFHRFAAAAPGTFSKAVNSLSQAFDLETAARRCVQQIGESGEPGR